jgi:hypothetical protein
MVRARFVLAQAKRAFLSSRWNLIVGLIGLGQEQKLRVPSPSRSSLGLIVYIDGSIVLTQGRRPAFYERLVSEAFCWGAAPPHQRPQV